MSPAWLHLILSHAPIFGCLAAAPMLILTEICDSDLLRKLACWYLLVAASTACGAYFTGSAAVESVFGPDQTGGDLVRYHALLGRIAFVGMILLGAAAGVALLQFVQDGRCAHWLRWTLIFLVLAHITLLAATSHAGGKIRRSPSTSPALEGGAEATELMGFALLPMERRLIRVGLFLVIESSSSLRA